MIEVSDCASGCADADACGQVRQVDAKHLPATAQTRQDGAGNKSLKTKIAKRSVEIAIEQNESAALEWIEQNEID